MREGMLWSGGERAEGGGGQSAGRKAKSARRAAAGLEVVSSREQVGEAAGSGCAERGWACSIIALSISISALALTPCCTQLAQVAGPS
ncbi:hypothetical protein BDU57DRAFT_513726 [Ampelomyces quisqualis]|uniref:Uncharacterized protein n=1 Tax=Ampelomyces quisqualis TaxID=50730 RepID=A0A6A5QS42_AMPQU|nr:hypothetical protein BDU57DRAFT_513726 [Ampelomyces quisqualis]